MLNQFKYAVKPGAIRARSTMDITADFKSFQERLTSSLVNVTRNAGQISAEDLGFHRSSNVKVSKSLDAQNAHLLQLTNKLLKAATKDTQIRQPKLHNHEDIEDKWRNIVDVIDDLLEKADACLDEYTGVIKRLSPSLQDGASIPPDMKERSRTTPSTFSSYVMPKPQLQFKRAVANHETGPFKPLLRTKPHAVIPLEESIGSGQE
jgi:exosome complex exonuclease RRP6